MRLLFFILFTTIDFFIHAQNLPKEGQEYVILNFYSEHSLDAPDPGRRGGGDVFQWQYFQVPHQHFKFIPGDEGCYKIQTNHGTFLSASSKVPGSRVIQGTTRNVSFQQWRLDWVDSIHFRVVNKATGMHLDLEAVSNKSRVPVTLNNKQRKRTQYWKMFPKPEMNLSDTINSEGKAEHLGMQVNTTYDEVYPVISPDGNYLYFNRKGLPVEGGFGNDDIFVSEKQANNSWSIATRLGQPINNASNNFLCSITPDGNTMLLGNKYKDGKCYGGLSISRKVDGEWTYPEAQQIIDYKNRISSAGYFLSNDQQVLLMAVKTDYCYGKSDIYVSFPSGDTAWTKPLNLGPVINTPVAENTPFLASDGKTIYFASEGHGGYGYSDIFVSRRLDDSWTNWTTPVNIGKPFNTSDWDAYFTIPASGDYAYFVSGSESYGKQDIFRYPLPKLLKPEPVLLVKGTVRNKLTGKPIQSQIVYQTFDNNGQPGTASSDSAGRYKIVLPAGGKYEFLPSKPGFVAESCFKLTDIEDYGEIEVDLWLIPLEENAIYVLNNLFFHPDHPEVMKESYPELNRLLKLMRENEELVIEVGGHTDSFGAETYNQLLSERRAKSVQYFLIQNGISKSRVSYKGYGESTPVADNETPEGRAKNRRVEVKFIKVK